MKTLMQTLLNLYGRLEMWLNKPQSLAILSARLYLSWIFWVSGLTKIRDWDSTLYLFQEEYHVPWLSPELAAYLGTGGELLFPTLLALGLFGRIGAIGLFVVNLVAVQSLPEIAPAAFSQHLLWGALLVALSLFGSGTLSADALLKKFARCYFEKGNFGRKA